MFIIIDFYLFFFFTIIIYLLHFNFLQFEYNFFSSFLNVPCINVWVRVSATNINKDKREPLCKVSETAGDKMGE